MSGKEVAEMLEEGNRRLQAFSTVGATLAGRPYASGKWTFAQILGHVADADTVCYTRLHQAIVEPSGTLFPVPMDGELWVEALLCAERPVDVSLAAIQGARVGMVHTLRTLPGEVLLKQLIHEEMGEVTPLQYARISAEHGIHHVAQLESIQEASIQEHGAMQ